MLCVRARGAVVRRKVASNVVLSIFPFPLWRAGFPFSLETSLPPTCYPTSVGLSVIILSQLLMFIDFIPYSQCHT